MLTGYPNSVFTTSPLTKSCSVEVSASQLTAVPSKDVVSVSLDGACNVNPSKPEVGIGRLAAELKVSDVLADFKEIKRCEDLFKLPAVSEKLALIQTITLIFDCVGEWPDYSSASDAALYLTHLFAKKCKKLRNIKTQANFKNFYMTPGPNFYKNKTTFWETIVACTKVKFDLKVQKLRDFPFFQFLYRYLDCPDVRDRISFQSSGLDFDLVPLVTQYEIYHIVSDFFDIDKGNRRLGPFALSRLNTPAIYATPHFITYSDEVLDQILADVPANEQVESVTIKCDEEDKHLYPWFFDRLDTWKSIWPNCKEIKIVPRPN